MSELFQNAIYLSVILLFIAFLLRLQKIFLKNKQLEDTMRAIWLSLVIGILLWVLALAYLLGVETVLIIIMSLVSATGLTILWIVELIIKYQDRLDEISREEAREAKRELRNAR